LSRSFHGSHHGWDDQASQKPNDGDDYQEFDKSEPSAVMFLHDHDKNRGKGEVGSGQLAVGSWQFICLGVG
jgi:hypothetical protein